MLSYSTAIYQRAEFWRIMRDLGSDNRLPTSILRENDYGIPIDEFPNDLRREVLDLLKWKQATYCASTSAA
jgi:hypothetical protein